MLIIVQLFLLQHPGSGDEFNGASYSALVEAEGDPLGHQHEICFKVIPT